MEIGTYGATTLPCQYRQYTLASFAPRRGFGPRDRDPPPAKLGVLAPGSSFDHIESPIVSCAVPMRAFAKTRHKLGTGDSGTHEAQVRQSRAGDEPAGCNAKVRTDER
jgi:hypothetical protein